MKESQDPMIPRKMELDKNPHGTELKISQQKELEKIWGIERSGFFNGREKWAKGFENQRV